MSKVITFINEKGGVGKSQIAFAVAWELANQGSKVLLIDLDGQRANLSFMAGIKKTDDMFTMYDVFQRNKGPEKAIMNIKENLDIIPANNYVSEISQKSTPERARNVIKGLESAYDYVFFDVPPSPDMRQFLSLLTSDYALVIMLPDIMSIEANNGIIESLDQVKEYNKKLKVIGILFNKHESRTNMSKQVQDLTLEYAKAMGTTVFHTKVRNAVSMAESVNYHIGITDYDKKSAVAEDIRQLITELKERVQ